MNTREILQCLQHIKFHTVGVYPADRIPHVWGNPSAFVFNTQKHNQHGAHWVAMYVDKNGVGWYFDSLGKAPHIPDHLRRIQRNCRLFSWNNIRLQSEYSNVCGHYCIMFLHYMCSGMGVAQFLSNFSQNLAKNDAIAKKFVEKLC